VKSLEQYEALKTNPSDLLVGWFTAKWSTAGKLFDSDFEKLAEQFPQV
jgi:ABC-type enterochelin transport system substrate-binding protein